VPTRPSGLGQQRREPQHPPVDRDVVDLDPALGQQLFEVAVGQAEAQVPADREDDDIRWEAEAGKGGSHSGRARAAGSHTGSLAARTRSPRMQQCRWHSSKPTTARSASATRSSLSTTRPARNMRDWTSGQSLGRTAGLVGCRTCDPRHGWRDVSVARSMGASSESISRTTTSLTEQGKLKAREHQIEIWCSRARAPLPRRLKQDLHQHPGRIAESSK
jgi:hypothetical protein